MMHKLHNYAVFLRVLRVFIHKAAFLLGARFLRTQVDIILLKMQIYRICTVIIDSRNYGSHEDPMYFD